MSDDPLLMDPFGFDCGDEGHENRRVLVASLFLPYTLKQTRVNGNNGCDGFPQFLQRSHSRRQSTASASLPCSFSSMTTMMHLATPAVSLTSSSLANGGLRNAVSFRDDITWVGCIGASEALTAKVNDLSGKLDALDCISVPVADDDLDAHYNQFCKQVLWKILHSQVPDYLNPTPMTQLPWKAYVKVNHAFASVLAEHYKPGDVVWINDYHLMLVPALLRSLVPNATIGFFLHVPFPSSEVFRCLPVRQEILEGLLGADLLGFQTYPYMRHFLSTCTRTLAVESTPNGIRLDDRNVAVGIFPIGINMDAIQEKRNDQSTAESISSLKEKYGSRKIIFGRDKCDYVKGIRHKLIAFERFLSQHPQYANQVVLIQVNLSTSEDNENEVQVSDIIARINSRFGTIEHQPVVCLQQDIPYSHYIALLTMADVCLITSLRDGMNLTSHEFVLCQEEKHSPLILSEFAGTYGSFGAAIRVFTGNVTHPQINPWNTQEVADAILDALNMPEDEKYQRWKELYMHVSSNTGISFTDGFLSELERVSGQAKQESIPQLPFRPMYDLYDNSKKRLLIFDHDGTIMAPFKPSAMSKHMAKVVRLLTDLTKDECNLVYVMSGRKRDDLKDFEEIPRIGLSAENGTFIKYSDQREWICTTDADLSWKKGILEVFEYYADRVLGSYIEQKDASIAWHYGHSDLQFATWQAKELQNHIEGTIGLVYPIHVLAKRKSVEVCLKNVNKGTAVRNIMDHHEWRSYEDSSRTIGQNNIESDFVLCVGDGRSDEFMFEFLNTRNGNQEITSSLISYPFQSIPSYQKVPCLPRRTIVTCKVGRKPSLAKWFIPGSLDLAIILEGFTKGKRRDLIPVLMTSCGRTNSSLSLDSLPSVA